MKLYLSLTLISGLFFTRMQAQETKKEMDEESIKSMCGCFEVSFKYTETFSPEIDYEKHLDYTAMGLEWAQAVVDSSNHISIQHILLVHDTMVIKHWRQDWTFENQEVFTYDKDNTWKMVKLPADQVKGQWTQKVYQVDDSPRYSGSSTWVHYDGKSYWENIASSPLPRREYSKRKDYNVMMRGNRQEIVENGWIHEQDNDKIIREDGNPDQLLVQEKGFNTYVKVDDAKCLLAKQWWDENQELWNRVVTCWDEVFEGRKTLSMKAVVDGKPLWMHFKSLNNNSSKEDIKSLINQFIIE